MLPLLFNSYEIISVSVRGPSFCLTSHFFTDYYLKENINDLDLRRSFYFKQDLKDTYYSSVYTGYKKTNITELIMEKSKEHIYNS